MKFLTFPYFLIHFAIAPNVLALSPIISDGLMWFAISSRRRIVTPRFAILAQLATIPLVSLDSWLITLTAIPVVAEAFCDESPNVCKSMYFIACRTFIMLLGIHTVSNQLIHFFHWFWNSGGSTLSQRLSMSHTKVLTNWSLVVQ